MGACTDLALRLRRGEGRVGLLLRLLLGLLAFGQVLVPELWQKPLPTLRSKLRVLGQLPLDHQCLVNARGGVTLHVKLHLIARLF